VFLSTSNCRSVYQDVPKDYYTLPLGKAALLKEGNLVIIALEQQFIGLLDTLSKNLKFQQILDLRTLQPLDTDAIFASVKKTAELLFIRRQHVWWYCK
jgi:2-oxoisovalerate dehydrogenase E1 component